MENSNYLNEQIITYLGNKRLLLSNIEKHINIIKQKLNKDKIDCVDLFSGSGIVARMLKKHANILYVNDLEEYSKIINECYLTNKNDFNEEKYDLYFKKINEELNNLEEGIISTNYSPKDENNITIDDRVFYTKENAMIIDTIRKAIDNVDEPYKKFFLAPLLYEASVHCNTSGVFKGFYKSKENGKGKYGGDGENALKRIKGKIELKKPIFSNYECDVIINQKDSNRLIKELPKTDVIYIDPPYNQHPYGSNYFMLNTILKNKVGDNISKVSGIPKEWNRSDYNKKNKINQVFEELIENCNASYTIVSYSSDGFIKYDDMISIMEKYGNLSIEEIEYPTFRGSRNLKDRAKHVTEYLFILEKPYINMEV